MSNTETTNTSNKECLREALESDLADFLNGGGVVTLVPFGESALKEDSLSKSGKLTSLNFRGKREVSSKRLTHNSNNKKVRIDIVKPVKKPKVAPEVKNKVAVKSKKAYTETFIRKKMISEAKNKAIDLGEAEFIAPCEKHGLTRYFIKSNGVRCGRCLKEREDEKSNKASRYTPEERASNRNRKITNQQRMNDAINTGMETFIGICHTCGEVPYAIREVKRKSQAKLTLGELLTTNAYHCIACLQESMKRSDAKRRIKRQLMKKRSVL